MIFETTEKLPKNILSTNKPKIGFLGMGWIGKNRLEAIRNADLTDVIAICDPYASGTDNYCKSQNIKSIGIYEELLQEDIAGIVIATPSALHKQQAISALAHGKAVFCQKPLACTAKETEQILDLAKEKKLLLMADMSYRYTDALSKIRDIIVSGEIGHVFAAHLTFHNAYGPDKSWYYKPELSGGGCVMDLGVHLIDMLFWIFPELEAGNICSKLFSNGKHLQKPNLETEDYGMVHIDFKDDLSAEVCCSWNLSAGRDAILDFSFYCTKGGASFSNINGSFYDFKAEIFKGTKTQVISLPPDEWGGKAAAHWASLLAEKNVYQSEVESYLKTAQILDRIYER